MLIIWVCGADGRTELIWVAKRRLWDWERGVGDDTRICDVLVSRGYQGAVVVVIVPHALLYLASR